MKTPESRGSIFDFVARRPVAVFMIVISATVFGFISYRRLSLNLMPDISYPTLTIRTQYPGAAPEEVEQEVTKDIEEIVGTVDNLVGINSVSRAGISDVILEFEWKTDMARAAQDVREKVDLLQLPQDVKRPLILRYDPTLDPIIRVGLYSPKKVSLYKLREYAEKEVKPALEAVGGVAVVKVHGGLERAILVELNEGLLKERKIAIQEILNRLKGENVSLAGGPLKEGETEYLLRTRGEFKSLDEIRDMVVATQGGRMIKLRDVARISLGHKDREVVTRIDGKESVEVAIYKEADANLVAVAQRVKNRIFGSPKQKAYLKSRKLQVQSGLMSRKARLVKKKMTNFILYRQPQGIAFRTLSDQSTYIRSSIAEVRSAAIIGGLFAVLVLFLFLRSGYDTLLIGLAIPISVIVTFAPMYIFGISLNVMSLGGLAMGIGMLVDNSIVVLESIHRCREEGDAPFQAAVRGTQEVGGAVFASTLTTISVFFPIVFVVGVAGQFFGDLALTVIFSMLASMIVALFFIPPLAALRGRNISWLTNGKGARLNAHFYSAEQLELSLIDLWKFTTRRPYLFPLTLLAIPYFLMRFLFHFVLEALGAKILYGLLLGLATLTALLYRIVTKILMLLLWPLLWPFEHIFGAIHGGYPRLLRFLLRHRLMVLTVAASSFAGAVYLVGNLGRELIPQLHQGEFTLMLNYPVGTPLEQTALKVRKVESEVRRIPGVASVANYIGEEATSMAITGRGENTAALTVALRPSRNLAGLENQVITKIRRILKDLPEVTGKIERPVLFSFKTPVELEIKGYDLLRLRRYTARVEQLIRKVKGVDDVQSTLHSGYPEIQIIPRRRALARHNLKVKDLADGLKSKIKGDVPTTFRERDRKIDILVRLRQRDRNNTNRVRQLTVNPKAQHPIPLEAVADFSLQEGPSEIRRLEGQRAAIITASLKPGMDLDTVTSRIRSKLSKLKVPKTFSMNFGGQKREMEVSLNSLRFALLLAIFLVYIVMAAKFESILNPLVILFSIPLAAIGVIFALVGLEIPLSIVVFLGLIMLAGIVVNDAIVLVDYIGQLRQRGLEKFKAIVEGSRVRFRPVIITTVTTILGLLPLALGLGEGAEIRQPMAITVIYGLISSTMLTLIVIPVIMSFIPARFSGGPKTEEDDVI